MEAGVSDDPFEEGYRGDAETANTSLAEQYAYQDGQAARRQEERARQEEQRQQWEQQDRQRRVDEDRAQEDHWTSSAPYNQDPVAGEASQEDDLLGFYVGMPLTAGVIAAIVALIVGHPPLFWGAVVGGGLFGVLVVLVIVAGGVLTLLWATRQVLSLWAWILVVAVLGAILGSAVATTEGVSSVLVQQKAIGFALLGGAAGLVLGMVNRVVRAINRA